MERNIDLIMKQNATVIRGNMYFFNIKDAYTIINVLNERRVCILGIEGFRLDEEYIYPDLDLIADFSSLFHGVAPDVCKKSIDAAIRFIKYAEHVEGDVYLEFVLKED